LLEGGKTRVMKNDVKGGKRKMNLHALMGRDFLLGLKE